MEITVSVEKFNELDKGLSIKELTQNKAKSIVKVGRKMYISNGAMAKPGRKHNWSLIWANECVHISQHKGESYMYDQRASLVLEGREELRGYTNQVAFYNGQKYVLIGERIEFVPADEEIKQTTLF